MTQLKMSPLTLLLFLLGLACNQVLADHVSEAIIGGDYAQKGHLKYQVSIHFGNQNENHNCGGAIIAEQYILTAAHCATNGGPHVVHQQYIVIAGIHNLENVDQAIIIPVETIYIHKKFDAHTYHHDIAILKLKHELNLSHHHHVIEKIDLPKSDQNLDDKDAIIAGFGLQNIKIKKNKAGQLEEDGGTSDGKLKYAHVKIYSQQHCVHIYSHDIIQSVFCGQVHQRNKQHYEGVCSGDSGSPLVHGHEVVGILSASPLFCDESTQPAKYTRVGSYLNMIKNVISGKPDNEVEGVNVPH